MLNDQPLLQTSRLQTGYRTGGEKKIVPAKLPDLVVHPGQLICLLGPNGSGKSTLLRTLAGLQSPLAGSIEIMGFTNPSPDRLARQVSLVLTDRVRGNNLTVEELVALGRYPYSSWMGTLTENDNVIIEEAMIAAGVLPLRRRKINGLSDGENQKMMLARALAQDTPLLMLDEPTAHLDLPSRIQLMRLLHRLAQQTGKGILLSTHELELALQVADEVWLLAGEEGLYKGAPEDLVLNGVIESVFSKEGILFDKQTGVFTIHREEERPIRLLGEGMAALWTKKALRRLGFLVQGEGSGPLVSLSTEGGKTSWILEMEGETEKYNSIADLLLALRTK